MRSQEAHQARVAWSSNNCSSAIQKPKRKVASIDGEVVNRPQKLCYPWDRLSELAHGRSSGHDRRGDEDKKIYLHGSCAGALRYLRSLSRTVLSTVQEVHQERGLLMADDDDDRSVNEVIKQSINSSTWLMTSSSTSPWSDWITPMT
jgi:hypothetical protein